MQLREQFEEHTPITENIHGMSRTSTAEERLANITPNIEKICRISGVPGASIGVIHGGEVSQIMNIGFSDLSTSKRTTSQTVYGIGSLTKAFIAAAVGILVDEGKLDWITPIKDVLPGFEHKNPIVYELLTIEDLLSHRSGLAGISEFSFAFQGDGEVLLPKVQLLPMFNQMPLINQIRQSFAYNVWGYSIISLVIENLTKKSLDTFLKSVLFDPLGMKNTSSSFNFSGDVRMAKPYAALSDGTVYPLPGRQNFKDTFFEGSGGIFSTLEDLLTWYQGVLSAIRTPDTSILKQIKYILNGHIAVEPPSRLERSAGLGWIRTQLPGKVGLIGDNADIWDLDDMPGLGDGNPSRLLIYHQGSTVGYYSNISMFPESNSAIIVLTNSVALSDAADWIARAVTEALFDFRQPQDYVALSSEAKELTLRQFRRLSEQLSKEKQERNPGILPLPLMAYMGRYRNKAGNFFVDIHMGVKTNSNLHLKFQGLENQSYELRHHYDNIFEWALTHDQSQKRGRYRTPDPEYFKFYFQVGATQCVHGLRWRINPAMPDGELLQKEEQWIEKSRVHV